MPETILGLNSMTVYIILIFIVLVAFGFISLNTYSFLQAKDTFKLGAGFGLSIP